ncbi:MAG: TonB-dependent receptor [Bacteroidales bacterium]|nr:TonB-dependent receptor [Bacteroidales bacterium]
MIIQHIYSLLGRAAGIVLAVLAGSIALSAQVGTVGGQVTDERGAPVIGASVQVLDSASVGTVTDMDGNYSLSCAPDAVLLFSCIGMKDATVAVAGRRTVDVVLSVDQQALDEVVVIGYQTIRKRDLTGAVSVVDRETLDRSSSSTIVNKLQGLATGINVRSTGQAGEDASIEIRGVGSLSDNSPLWVVDGMITTPGVGFNAGDIASIQILKDASAAAIYGSRAANGVIIITTKDGGKGPMQIHGSFNQTWEWSPRYDLMGAEEFKYYNDLAYTEAIKDGVGNIAGTQHHPPYDTDWQDAVLRTASSQDYGISLSGGGDSGRYYVSGSYLDKQGVTYGNAFQRYTFRVNTSGEKGIFSFGENLLYNYTDKDPLQTNPYNDFMRMLPTIPVYDENNPGGYGYGSGSANTFGTNPIARENLEYFRQKEHRLNGNVWLQLKPFSWLAYKLNAGLDYYFYTADWFRGVGNWTQNQEYRDSQSNKHRDITYNRLVEHTLNFDRDFGVHHVDAVLGMTYQTYYWSDLGGTRYVFPEVGGEYLTVLNAGSGTQSNWNSEQKNALISYLGRVNYNYDNRYYASVTFRRDGTSRLSPQNRWGTFPSFSGAWRISRERFFDISWIDDLKLRANWGRLGNSAIGNWDYIGTVNQSLIAIIGGQKTAGGTQVKIVNSDLRWETKETLNAGLDAAFLASRLTLEAEYYRATTRDVLTSMPIAAATGNDGGAPVANAASLRNVGVELSLGWKDHIGAFYYGVKANLTTLRNEVLDLGYGKDTYINGEAKSSIGQPLSMFFLRKTDGIFRTQEEIDAYVTSEGVPILINGKRPQLGDVRYVDTDDNGNITDDDRQIVGNPWPKALLGLNLSAQWRGFDFSMDWYGQFGNKVYDVDRWQGRYFADDSAYIRFKAGEEPWQVNPDSNTPRIIYGDARNTMASDRYLEDGSYFRMKNIQVGYTFSPQLIGRAGIESLRLFASGSNLVTFTRFKGLDPDFKNTNVWNRGTHNFNFPNLRAVQFGIDLNF